MFEGEFWGEVIVKCSRQPLLDAARRLLADGHAADEVLMMVHSNRTQKLKLTLGATARPVDDNETPRWPDTMSFSSSEALGKLILPEVFEPVQRQGRVANRGHDRSVAEIGLDGARVMAVVGELEPTGMPQHVGMHEEKDVQPQHRPILPGAGCPLLGVKQAAVQTDPSTPFRCSEIPGVIASYGFDTVEPHREAAAYVDRILKGEKPGNLPVQAPTKYELVINLKTAKALGLAISRELQLRADELIE